jgi:protein-tyrosine phosphatase
MFWISDEMFEMIPNLWLGGFSQATTFTSLHETFVVNCTKNLQMLSMDGIRIPVDDDGTRESSHTMFTALSTVTKEIHKQLQDNKKVVVHCLAGQSRSPTVVCAYLMEYANMTIEEGIRFIREKKPDAFFWQVNFREALEHYAILLGKPPKM